MKYVEFIYVAMTFASIALALPQLRQLWRMKNSDEFSLTSWTAWLCAQFSSLAYAIAIKSVPYFIVNCLWLSFYVSMIVLILKFRVRPVQLAAVSVAENSN